MIGQPRRDEQFADRTGTQPQRHHHYQYNHNYHYHYAQHHYDNLTTLRRYHDDHHSVNDHNHVDHTIRDHAFARRCRCR